MTKYSAIGILGGTFDPVHYGHLRMALELHNALELQQIRFIPCQQPALKISVSTNANQRLTMLKIAIQNQPAFSIDERELNRPGPSYTYETLQSLREELNPSQPLCLIIGSDLIEQLPQWHRWQELLNFAHIVIAYRIGYPMIEQGMIADYIKKHLVQSIKQLHEKAAGYTFLQPISKLEIASSQIRQLLATGKSPRYLLPEAVLDYIYSEKLYGVK